MPWLSDEGIREHQPNLQISNSIKDWQYSSPYHGGFESQILPADLPKNVKHPSKVAI